MDEAITVKRQQISKQMLQLTETLINDPSYDPEEWKRITELGTTELLQKLREGELTAVTVLKAFQKKALDVTRHINCVTEFIPDAEKWALAVDQIPAEERRLLHGIPVSIKENINIRGMDSTMGLAKKLYNPAASNAVIVEALLNNGAIPFCKTNVPQAMLSFCCTNPVFGITHNPHIFSRTPGGSSGGEAALIASGASVLGVGSDLAGSVRIPANFSGCVALKPTLHRISNEGFLKGLDGEIGVTSCPGILGRDVSIVKTCLTALTTNPYMSNLDCLVTPIPWHETILNGTRKLTFGYYDDVDCFPCTPGVKRAVIESRIALQKAGHTVVPFELVEKPSATFTEITKLVYADLGQTVQNHIEHETIDPSLYGIKFINASYWTKMLIKIYAGIMYAAPFYDSYMYSFDLWQGLNKRDKYINQLSKRMKENHIDLLLTPVYAMPAPQQYIPTTIPTACFYTVLFNYCDFPSGTVPVTKESDEDQRLLEETFPEDSHYHRIVKKATRGATGLPIGVLITGLRWQEELVCRGLAELEKALKEQN